jgi:PAS domain S-box-containing protein
MGSATPGATSDDDIGTSEALTGDALKSLAGAILEAAHNAQLGVSVTLVDDRPMRRIYVNDAAERIFGYTSSELLKLPTLFTFTPEEQARIEALDARRRKGETVPLYLETTVLRKDGSRIPIELAFSPVTLNGRTATIAFLRDIRERRKTEEALRQSESMFRKLIEAAPEAVVVTRDGSLVYVNPAFLSLLGYERFEEIASIPAFDLVHEDDRATLIQRGKEFGATYGTRPPDEFRMTKKNGDVIAVESSWLYVDFEGKPASLSFMRNVTERKQAQAQLIQTDRMATIGTLAAGVAHELNNPLAYVMLNLNLLDKELGELLPKAAHEKVKARLFTLQQGTERMASIVRDLRSLCRPDAPTVHPVDVRSVLESTVNMSLNELKGRARIVRDYGVVPHVVADGARLGQVFLNLILNAAHAIAEGRPDENEVRISLAPWGPDHVRVAISDTGHGIPASLLGKIFEPFFTTKPAGVGMGLGLSISQSIVASMRGKLAVESREGKGTTFYVTIPVGTGERETDRSADSPLTAPAPADARVLVVDDEPSLASALGTFLSLDHHVTVVGRGDQALGLLSDGQRFDAIVCDVLMPKISGIELYEELEKSHPEMLPRVIFMTGAATIPRVAEFLARIRNARIDKPIDVEQLRRTIDTVVSSARTGVGE